MAFGLVPKEVSDDALAFLGESIGGIFGLRPSDEVVIDVPKGRIHGLAYGNDLVGKEVMVGEPLIVGNVGVVERRNEFEIAAGDASGLPARAKASVAQKERHNLTDVVNGLVLRDWVGKADSNAGNTTEVGMVKSDQRGSGCWSGIGRRRGHGLVRHCEW